jgi:hypothetical protein
MAASVILGILVVSFMSFSGFSLFAAKKSDRSIEAQRIAEKQLNIARQYVSMNPTLPAKPTVPGYEITIQATDLVNNINYITTSFLANHISLQAIVFMNSIPKVLTVTVSWSSS